MEMLRQFLDRILTNDPELSHEIEEAHPQVIAELPSRSGFEASHAPVDPAAVRSALETIVQKKGRPVLTVRRNDLTFKATDIGSKVWKSRLKAAREGLRRAIPSVGRIEVANDPSYTWLGTAWLVSEDLVVTNRHIAVMFAHGRGDRFVFRTSSGSTKPMTTSIDFLQEDGEPARRVLRLGEILYIEPEPGPDLAFLRIDRQSGKSDLPGPIPLRMEAPEKNQFIAAIGYPARDSRVPDQDLVSRIFGNIYDKKRLAPGALTKVDEEILLHDCSTLGGNSGSVLIDLDSGEAVGLHWAGLYLQANYAVSAAIVRDRLDKLRRGARPGTPRREEGRLVIDGVLRREIREAILDAFDSLADFAVVAAASLGTTLTKITTATDLEVATFEVILWATSKRRLPALVFAAAWKNPGSERLQTLAARFEHAAEFGRPEQVVLKGVPFQSAGNWPEKWIRLRRQVCRIEPQPPPDTNGYGTGFLIAPDIVMTNFHVVRDFPRNPTRGAGQIIFRFDYQLRPDGVSVSKGRPCTLADDWLLFHSTVEELDYALVRLAERPGNDQFGKKRIRGYMEPVSYAFSTDEPLFILQHPDAGPMALIAGYVPKPEAGDWVTYNANTKGGSSGSPCLTMGLEVAAIHHWGSPNYNRGVRFASILGHLKANQDLLKQRGLVSVLGLEA